MKHKIYNWSLGYELGRIYLRLAHRLFYNKIVIKGKENIPFGTPVILTPNHQNAIMDAMAIVCLLPGQNVFMARADVFQNRWIAKILRFLKIMPIYRMRDGIENIGKNSIVFADATEVLQNKKMLCLMPEGTHGDKRQLKPLVKGTFRLALSAAEKFPELCPVIVPVGIDYSDYSAYRSQLIIQFGKPINVAGYVAQYKTKPVEALKSMKKHLENEMKKLMLHIDCGKYYDIVDYLRYLYRPVAIKKFGYKPENAWHRYLADKWFVDKCNDLYLSDPDYFEKTETDLKPLRIETNILKISPEAIFMDVPDFFRISLMAIRLLILLPIFACGFIIHAGLIYLPKILNRRIDDTQFHSSVKYTLVSLLFPFYYCLLWLVVSIFIKNIILQIAVLGISVLTGILAIIYYELAKEFFEILKIKIYKSKLDALRTLVNRIFGKIENISD